MANENETLLREVDQELAQDRQLEIFRKHGAALIAGAVAIVAAVAGWQVWTHMKTSAAEAHALEFRNAVELLETDREAGRAALDALAQENSGYAALAALRRAASYAAGGERLKALESYRAIARGGAPKRVREMAQLRAGYLSLADGRDAVMSDLGSLAEDKGPFGYYARELLGLASLQAKDYESAEAAFSALAGDANAPAGIQDRAAEFAALTASAKAGVNITGEARVEDLLRAVGEGATDVVVDEHAGHDHGDENATHEQAGDEQAGDDAAPDNGAADEGVDAAETGDSGDQDQEE